MPSKNKKAVNQHHMSTSEKKERAQQKLINAYKRQQKWLMWAGIVILILILFLLMVAWYSYDWGNDSTKDALKQNTPTTSTGTKSGAGAATGTSDTRGSGGGGSTTTTGGGTTSTGSTADNTSSTTSDEQRSSTNSSTTTNNTTTTTTTNNNTTTGGGTGQSDSLLNVYADTNVGETLDSLFNRVSELGLGAECRIELVVVKVCDIVEGDNVVTVKALLTNNLITSITKNF